MSDFVEIVEVGPRDGLQNEPEPIPLKRKIDLINTLSSAGFRRIEVASFVSPKWVPQMADSARVLSGITRVPGVSYAALTPNMRGFNDAVAARASEVAVFASASEGFSRANVNASVEDALARMEPVCTAAREAGIPVRGYVSCVVECPYDGHVAPSSVADVVTRLRAMGCYEISLGDTIGRATPEAMEAMLKQVTLDCPPDQLAGHFHDTSGRALDNVAVALSHKIRVFDAAVGGLGGCPYAPGAAGNLATEALLAFLETQGYKTGLDPKVVARAALMAREIRNV